MIRMLEIRRKQRRWLGGFAWSSDGSLLSALDHRGQLSVFQAITGAEVGSCHVGYGAREIAWIPGHAVLHVMAEEGLETYAVAQPEGIVRNHEYDWLQDQSRGIVSWSPSGQLVAADRGPYEVAVFSVDGRIYRVVAVPNARVSGIAWASSGDRLAVANGDRLEIVDLQSTTTGQALIDNQSIVRMQWCDDDRRLITVNSHGAGTIWNLDEPGRSWSFPITSGIVALDVSTQSSRVWTLAWDGTLAEWDVASGKCGATVAIALRPDGIFECIACRPHADTTASFGSDGNISIVIWCSAQIMSQTEGRLSVEQVGATNSAGMTYTITAAVEMSDRARERPDDLPICGAGDGHSADQIYLPGSELHRPDPATPQTNRAGTGPAPAAGPIRTDASTSASPRVDIGIPTIRDDEPLQVIHDEASWRRRLAEEVDRSAMFQQSLAVLAITGAPAHLEGALRGIDVIGRCDEDHVVVLLPEADPMTARQLAAAVLEAVRGAAPAVQVGIATCPFDATDPDNLVLAARAAAAVAGPAEIATSVEAAIRIVLGEREVLVCHPAMVRVFGLLERLAKADLPVLIIGETGVGKENAAYAVHHYSERREKSFVALNCAAVPEALVESQLFGHDKGAFTGATTARAGLFETASGGTLFLDEIGELTPPVQAKLLRALETGRITRVGETWEREVDLRIVTATNRLLEQEVEAKRFREDLYFRLGAARVHLPPLRDRRCEIPLLFREFLARAAERAGRTPPEPTPPVLQRMLSYRWPGNIRELKHVADFVMATIEGDRIEPTDLPPQLAGVSPHSAPFVPAGTAPQGAPMRRLADELEELERQRIIEALARTHGVKTRAAALLGMPIRTFKMKVKQYGL